MTMESLQQLNLNQPRPLREQGHITSSLWEVVDQFRRGIIQKPPHQRDLIWNDFAKHRWISRLVDPCPPIGVIVTYQLLNGLDRTIYLNDGHQRISTTTAYLEDPLSFGHNEDTAEAIVRACTISLQHRHYENPMKALWDFQGINLGTNLTPLEFYKGLLTYIPNYDLLEPYINQVHEGVDKLAAKIIVAYVRGSARDRGHNFQRHDYAMFYRFISERRDAPDYRVATKSIMAAEKTGNIVEQLLADRLKDMSISEVKSAVTEFLRHIANETATVEQIWFDQLGHRTGDGIVATLYRWIMECSILKRHNGIKNNVWESFMIALLRQSQGRARLIYTTNAGRGETCLFGLGSLKQIKMVSTILNVEFYNELQYNKPRRKNALTRPGYDSSHILPFRDFGDGITITESASKNRARGAKPMEIAAVGNMP